DVFRAVGLQEAGESADAPVMPLDPASLANRLSTFLENRVLVPANVVDADEASVTYGIRAADLLCSNTSGSVQTGTGALVAYTQCRVLYADLELLVRAELRDDGMDLTLMVGRDRLEPLTVELRDEVTLARLNLPIALEAASVFMDRLPPSKRVELPEIQALEGEVTLAIETPEPALATVTLEVTEAIRMDLMNQGKPLTLSVAPGVLSVSADGTARELAMTVALGETELLASDGWAFDAGMEVTCGVSDLACAPERRSFQVNGAIVGQLAGLTGEARLQEDTEVFELTGLGLGTSTSRVTLDQEEVFSLDLNPADGRLVDLFMIRDTTGLNVEV
ncbi:MAG: hypothetical protein VX938_10825, partial [Myxococcota bacterium]|nr:hypothetical protein [Myxococcota bacterium]